MAVQEFVRLVRLYRKVEREGELDEGDLLEGETVESVYAWGLARLQHMSAAQSARRHRESKLNATTYRLGVLDLLDTTTGVTLAKNVVGSLTSGNMVVCIRFYAMVDSEDRAFYLDRAPFARGDFDAAIDKALESEHNAGRFEALLFEPDPDWRANLNELVVPATPVSEGRGPATARNRQKRARGVKADTKAEADRNTAADASQVLVVKKRAWSKVLLAAERAPLAGLVVVGQRDVWQMPVILRPGSHPVAGALLKAERKGKTSLDTTSLDSVQRAVAAGIAAGEYSAGVTAWAWDDAVPSIP